MKTLIFIILILTSCNLKIKPEFYIDGKPYYTSSRCVESKTTSNWEYHYGYNMMRGKFEFHYGPNTKTECLKSVIDTIEIK